MQRKDLVTYAVAMESVGGTQRLRWRVATMLTVDEALDRGWEVVLPVQRMTHDDRVILMRHRRVDGLLELGHARTQAERSESRPGASAYGVEHLD